MNGSVIMRSESLVVCARMMVVDVRSNFGQSMISVCDGVEVLVCRGEDNDDSNWVRRSIVEDTVMRNTSISFSAFEDEAMIVAMK